MTERPQRIKDYLLTHIAYEMEDYITQLEADKELLDKLREWLRAGPVEGRLGSEYTNGYLQAVNYVARVIEEQKP